MILRYDNPQGQRWCGPLVQGAALVQVRAEKSRRVNALDKVDRWTAWTAAFSLMCAPAHTRTRTWAGARTPSRARGPHPFLHIKGERE